MPPSRATTERNNKILLEYMNGNITQEKLAEKYAIPRATVSSIVRSGKKRFIPDNPEQMKNNIQKKMEDRITEALERQIALGESMIKKATDNVENIPIETAQDLSTVAKAGTEIARKGYGIKEQDDRVTAIQINLTTALPLGAETIGTVTTIKTSDITIKDGNTDNDNTTIIPIEDKKQ